MPIINRAVDYFKSSQQELKKVVWPSKKEITHHTLLVIVISLGVAAFLAIVDYILTLILGRIL
jgi:preprotein translocase SecE subunit